MSNLIRYIVQDDPEEIKKKREFFLSPQKQTQDQYEHFKFSQKNLLEKRDDIINNNSDMLNKEKMMYLKPKAQTSQISRNQTHDYMNISSKTKVNFDDVYFSELSPEGKVIYRGTQSHEGGYSNRKNDLGGRTNYGVRQEALNEYNLWRSSLKNGKIFPTKIENLTQEQAQQIMNEMYYQRYNINKLQNLILARNTFDAEINQGTDAGKMLAAAMNEFYGYIPNQSTRFFNQNIKLNDSLVNAVNRLTPEETIKVNDIFTRLRMDRYFQNTDKNPVKNINNIKGWYNRAKSYYSNQKKFEQLYRHKVDEYIKSKYPQYYTGM